MTITIVLPFVNLTGGVRVMLDYANWLHDAGHRVCVLYPRWPYRFALTRRQRWHEFRKQVKAPAGVPWLRTRCEVRPVPLVRAASVPRADLVIATSWPTVPDVWKLPASRGRKLHIVMHHETGTGPEKRIREIYSLRFHRIAFSEFVRGAMQHQFRCRIDAVVPNGTDTSLFFPDGARDSRMVLMLYHPAPRKGAEDGLAALAALRARVPDLRARIIGTVRPIHPLPPWAAFEWQVDDATLRRAYSSAAAFLYPSRLEGFGLPPLEAMACGCPVVTTAVGAVPEFAAHERNALVVDPRDVRAMTAGLERLLLDDAAGDALARAGLETAAMWSLDRVAPRFESALLDAVRSQAP